MPAIRTTEWTVRAVSVADEPLSITCNERPFDQEQPGRLGQASPVEYLLISIAGCFALSCRMALAQRKRSADSFRVTAHGRKAPDAPSQLQAIDIEVEFPSSLGGDAVEIARRAKQLCTVTNTLARALEPVVQVRAL